MLTAGEIGFLTTAMSIVKMQPDLVDRVVKLLTDNSEQLKQGREQVTQVTPDSFGGSPTGHRIGTNTLMAHQAVEEEFKKLADSLAQYSDAIVQWAREVDAIDADTSAEMSMRAEAVAEVNARLAEASKESTDQDMGDGTFTPPPSSPETAAPTTSEGTS